MSSTRPPTIGGEIGWEFPDEEALGRLKRLSNSSVNECTYKREQGKYCLTKQQHGGTSPAIPPRISSQINEISVNTQMYNSPNVFRKASQSVHPLPGLIPKPETDQMLNCVGKCAQRRNIDGMKKQSSSNAVESDQIKQQSNNHGRISSGGWAASSQVVLSQNVSSEHHPTAANTEPLIKTPNPSINSYSQQACWKKEFSAVERDEFGPQQSIIYARALAPFKDSSYGNTLNFEKNEIICVFVDSMSHASNNHVTPRSTTAVHPPLWRGFRFTQGPNSTGYFPSGLVSSLNQGDTPDSMKGQSSVTPSLQKPKKHLDQPQTKAALVDLAIQTEPPSQLDESSCSTNDSTEDNEDDFINECEIEEERMVSNGNEEAFQVGSRMFLEIENMAQSALKTSLNHSKHCNNVLQSRRPPNLEYHGRKCAPQSTIAKSIFENDKQYCACGQEPLYASSRNSATSLDSGRGSAYTNGSDGGKPVSLPYSGLNQTSNEIVLLSDDQRTNHAFLHNSSPRHIYLCSGNRIFANNFACRREISQVSESSPVSDLSGSSDTSHNRRPNMQLSSTLYARNVMNLQAESFSKCRAQTCCADSPSNGSDGSVLVPCAVQHELLSQTNKKFTGLITKIDEKSELMENWLCSAGFSDYFSRLIDAGYDLDTLSRATPEELNACGITNPHDRQRLRKRLGRLQLPESIPDCIPESVREWLEIINLSCYWPDLESQGLTNFNAIISLTWDDLEDIGIRKLGHQKKITLAIERLRRLMLSVDSDKFSHRNKEGQQRKYEEEFQENDRWSKQRCISQKDEDEDVSEIGSTPSPPPAFQDPPNFEANINSDIRRSSFQSDSGRQTSGLRKLSLDIPALQPCPYLSKANCSIHYSTENISEFGHRMSALHNFDLSSLPPVSTSPYCKFESDPCESICNSSGASTNRVYFSSRQNLRSMHNLNIPVCAEILPALSTNSEMDPDIQDMQNMRSMLDKLSAHLVPNSSA